MFIGAHARFTEALVRYKHTFFAHPTSTPWCFEEQFLGDY